MTINSIDNRYAVRPSWVQSDTASNVLFSLTDVDLKELESATGATVRNGQLTGLGGGDVDQDTANLFFGLAEMRAEQRSAGQATTNLTEAAVRAFASDAYASGVDVDPGEIDRLVGQIKSGNYGQVTADSSSGATSDFLEFMQASPEERALMSWLAQNKMTWDQFKSLPGDDRAKLLDKFKQDMKALQEAKYGIGSAVDAAA